MKQQRPQLGRGLADLLGVNQNINTALKQEEQETKEFSGPKLVAISEIVANKGQPRKTFADQAIKELSQSIKENGIIQPLIVTPTENNKFMIIAGERRFRASKLAGLTHVPVVIKKTTKKDILLMAIIENVQRDDLNCVEEALAYYQLMSEFGLTQEEVAKKIGKDRSTIANFLRILKLPREALVLIKNESLSFGHAKVLASIKDDEQVKRLALLAVQNGYTVRELEKEIKAKKRNLEAKPKSNFFNEKLDGLRQNLEKKTGFHFALKASSNGNGVMTLKFNNEAEFNDIYEYLMRN